KRPTAHHENDAGDDASEPNDIPELEDVVETSSPAEPAPPPNLDMFADLAIDVERLREELLDQLSGEIEIVVAQVRADIEQTLRVRLDAQLRDRLPEILDQVLRDNGEQPE
ncbi:MAG: hypothetical protein KY410_09970, partial [Proteobacteria bacterium]|nr:hypothetical protein [Pseudomonadota bacterium]